MMLSGILDALHAKAFKTTLAAHRKFVFQGKLDGWEGSDGRTQEHRGALDRLAMTLSNFDSEVIRSWFNFETGRAELFRSRSGEIIAEIEIVGEWGEQAVARVTLICDLPENLKACFEEHIPLRVEFIA